MQVFSEHVHSPGHMQSPTHACDLLGAQKVGEACLRPHGELIPQSFLLWFMISLLSVQLLPTALASHEAPSQKVKQQSLSFYFIFLQTPLEKSLLH